VGGQLGGGAGAGHGDRGVAGEVGELVAELLKDPDKQVERAVENFRKVVQAGGLGPA
jgi:hypothetical protein